MVVHPCTRSRPLFFLCASLLRLSSNHVATLRISAANSPLFPVNAPTKSSAGLDAHLTAASVTATITPTRADYRDLRCCPDARARVNLIVIRAVPSFISFFHRQNIAITSGFSTSPRNKRSPRSFRFPQTSTRKKSRGDKLAESIKRNGLSGVSRMTVIVSGAYCLSYYAAESLSRGYYEISTEPTNRRIGS